MKDPKIHSGMYPGLEQLPTPELEELLRQDFAAGEGQSNLELVTAILEVIAQREALTQPSEETDAAWQQVRARAIEETAAPVPSQEAAAPVSMSQQRQKRRIAPRRAIAVAAVVCVLVCLLIVPAYGSGKLQEWIQWDGETFEFLSEQNHALFDSSEYQNLETIISTWTDLPVLPTWYPSGTELQKVETSSLPDSENVTALFSVNEESLILTITVYDAVPEYRDSMYQKDEGSPEEYYVNQIPHYLYDNMGRSGAAWWNENVECVIHGELNKEQIKQMIDSIYE